MNVEFLSDNSENIYTFDEKKALKSLRKKID